ncbi:putative UPF0481 protein At3g02645 [Camellia sinensis]|uniref:putative UPF0481 protein At3g02645 n=1 Tax=Camellia sinensis TaxID=4442 RepID=UPI001035F436|nr:putative UPF0481 protein At3g02645 [Camellia sinensis]
MVSQSNVPIKQEFLKSATELHEAGIKFKKVEEGSLFNIKFVNGTIEIPTLKVDDDTESFLRNLLAYENYLPVHDTSRNYFTVYMKFMDFLVNSSKDVEILSHKGIIHNLLGDNAVVSTMLSKLGNNVVIPFLGYHEVYYNVNKHSRKSWNIWLATLRREYFNTPWTLISFLAALLLLVLTVVQPIFSSPFV